MKAATPGPWEVYDAGLADWARSPFNPWRRLFVTTPRPANAGPDVKFGHIIAKIEGAAGDHERAEADAALIASLPDIVAERDEARSLLSRARRFVSAARDRHACDDQSTCGFCVDAMDMLGAIDRSASPPPGRVNREGETR